MPVAALPEAFNLNIPLNLMEFRGLLALAYKNQQRQDKEIKQLEELAKAKKQERFKELASAKSSRASMCFPTKEKEALTKVLSHNIPNDGSAIAEKPQAARLNIDVVKRETISKPSKLKPVSDKGETGTHPKPLKEHTPDSNARPNDTLPVNKKAIKSKPSFTELLELAKKNVGAQQVKRKAFDDLIPCSLDSGYRNVDNPTQNAPKSCSNAKQPATESLTKQSVSRPLLQQNRANGVSDAPSSRTSSTGRESQTKVTRPLTDTSEKNREQAQKRPHQSTVSNPLNPASHSSKSQKPPEVSSRSAIAMQLGAKSAHPTPVSRPQNTSDRQKPTSRPPSTTGIPRSPSIPVDSKAVQSSHTTKVKNSIMSSKRLTSDLQPVQSGTTGNSNLRGDQMKHSAPVTSAKKLNGLSINSSKKTEPLPSLKKPPPARPAPAYPVRGIAAQLGMKPPSTVEDDDYGCSEDDYESDDSFIDDSEALETKEYARVVRDVHKALRFDPRKYKEVNPFDDLRSMEANYRDIEKEEKRSARIAAQEDALELERDLERKRRKMMMQT